MQDNRKQNNTQNSFENTFSEEPKTSNFNSIGMSSGILGISAGDTGENMNYMKELAKKILEEYKNEIGSGGIKSSVSAISGSNHSNQLKSDVVAITFTKGKKAVTRAFLIIPQGTEYSALTVQENGTTLELARYHSDQDDDTMTSSIVDEVSKSTGIAKKNIYKMKSVALPPSYKFVESTESDTKIIITRVIQSIASQLLIDVLGEVPDITLDDIRSTNGPGIDIAMTKLNPSKHVKTADGTLIAPSLCLDIKALYSGAKISKNKSVHGGGSHGESIAKVHIRTSTRYVPGQRPNQSTANINQAVPELNCWQPHFIIDNIEMPTHSTIGRQLIVLGCTTAFHDRAMMESLFGNEIGALNIRNNLLGEKTPSIIPPSRVAKNHSQIFGMMFNPNILLSIVVRPGDLAWGKDHLWLDAVNRPDNYITKAAGYVLGGPILTNSADRSIVNQNVDVELVGTWEDGDGKTQPISMIDIVWLLTNFGNQPELIGRWIEAHSGNMAPRIRLAKKLDIIRIVTNGRYQVTDKQLLVTFNSQLPNEIRRRMVEKGISIQTNDSLLGGANDDVWSGYLASGSAFNPDEFTSSPFVNTGYSNGNKGYIPPISY